MNLMQDIVSNFLHWFAQCLDRWMNVDCMGYIIVFMVHQSLNISVLNT